MGNVESRRKTLRRLEEAEGRLLSLEQLAARSEAARAMQRPEDEISYLAQVLCHLEETCVEHGESFTEVLLDILRRSADAAGDAEAVTTSEIDNRLHALLLPPHEDPPQRHEDRF